MLDMKAAIYVTIRKTWLIMTLIHSTVAKKKNLDIGYMHRPTCTWFYLQDKLALHFECVVVGDARNDSPGFCAQYSTFTFMENVTKKILCIKTVDKRETDRKSTNMEKEGFKRALAELQAKDVGVKEIVTDGHPGIALLMRKYIQLS